MTPRPRRERWQRLGLMVLVVGLAVAGLATQPSPLPEAPRFRVTPVPAPRPSPRLAALSAATAVTPPADLAPYSAGESHATDTTADVPEPAERGPFAPDVVVALEQPEAGARPPFLRVSHVHTTDSAQWMPGPVLPLMDSVMASGDGIEGFEPGALYWFGPRGLEKVQVSMEAQR